MNNNPFLNFKNLHISELLWKITSLILIICLIIVIIYIIEKIILHLLKKYFNKDNQTKTIINFISIVIKTILGISGLLIILSIAGINITGLATGLGIGGIVMALAAQNILADLFSSFTIFLDKPFKPGDNITVGTESGLIQKIGLKTTRLEGPSGETIIIANKELANARIHNFHKYSERQIKLQLPLAMATNSKQIKQALAITETAIQASEQTVFIRANLINLNTLEILYKIQNANLDFCLNIQQEILFKIKDELDKNKITFAPPNQTIILK